ncbi:hypothetical protein HMPREF0972_00647 [Actinomyces sp. oral taxon 848 str. F0332]|nr:hypothetical protein HMPREF0972_00647 [Actinomyces sp. oral taxon 848 str. F0332]
MKRELRTAPASSSTNRRCGVRASLPRPAPDHALPPNHLNQLERT